MNGAIFVLDKVLDDRKENCTYMLVQRQAVRRVHHFLEEKSLEQKILT